MKRAMKSTRDTNLLVVGAAMTVAGLLSAGRLAAQTLTNLYSFTATPASSPYTNGDGATPNATLVVAGSTLYGTTKSGGSQGRGTVFKLGIDATGFTNLHNFAVSDGDNYFTRLVLAGTNLYGTADHGGTSGNGTVFKLNINGTGFTNLHHFTATSGAALTNSDGATPEGGLVLAGDTLFGTTYVGGSSGQGAIFAVNTDGTGFTNLHSFTAGTGSYPFITNSDGIRPESGLLLSGDTL
jgi:uncharacterized repeat protein (TIGR03803 family)